MIDFQRYKLDNGLTLLVHTDRTTPLVAVCMTYQVGTRDEHPARTGFAHLFEHLMFGGSKNAPNFDDWLQRAGGENNAFTNQDMTVYYEVVPRENLETALWLEADRMADLLLNKRALNVQRKVVVEEFKETCLNEPYGDVWHHLSPLAYRVHPYQVPTIGKTFEHIEQASLEDVQQFFQRFYRPNNAILSLCGNIEADEARQLVEKWFGNLPAGEQLPRVYPAEPAQTEARMLTIEADVPLNALFIAFQGARRQDADYYAEDLLSDVLAEGESARLFKKLVKDTPLFTELDAYTTGTLDTSLFVVEGKLYDNVSFEQAEEAIWNELKLLAEEKLSITEWERLQNRVENNVVFGELSAINKAINLGLYEVLGDATQINQEAEFYRQITPERLQQRAQQLFQPQHSSTVYYRAQKS